MSVQVEGISVLVLNCELLLFKVAKMKTDMFWAAHTQQTHS